METRGRCDFKEKWELETRYDLNLFNIQGLLTNLQIQSII